MDHFRCLLTKLFGIQWVLLTDMDGEVRIRRVRFRGGKPYAQWMEFNIRPVELLEGGKLGNGCYVESWEPAYVCGPKSWPAPEQEGV